MKTAATSDLREAPTEVWHRRLACDPTGETPVPQHGRVCVIPLEPHRAAAWRSYVKHHTDATLFHGLEWKQAIERVFGHRSRFFLACRGDTVVGVLPLFEVHSLLAGRMLVSVPYGTYGGILADDDAAGDALFAEACSLAERVGARSIELRSTKAGVSGLAIQRTHATFRKELPTSVDQVPGSFPRKARAAARQAAERNALTVEFDDSHVPVVWDLYARSMRRLASINYPRRLFDELLAATPGGHGVQLVRCAGRPVGGLVSFLYRDTIMPYFVGVDERAAPPGLNNFLYMRSMQWGVENGYRVYDFGRTRVDNVGPFNFKRFCGFEPTPLEYQTWVAPGRTAPDLSPASPRWSAARRVWRTLPLTITRPLGGWLAKSIPG